MATLERRTPLTFDEFASKFKEKFDTELDTKPECPLCNRINWSALGTDSAEVTRWENDPASLATVLLLCDSCGFVARIAIRAYE